MLNTHKPVTTGILGQTQQTAATTGLLAQRKRMASERTAMARRMKEVLPSTSSSTATPSTTLHQHRQLIQPSTVTTCVRISPSPDGSVIVIPSNRTITVVDPNSIPRTAKRFTVSTILGPSPTQADVHAAVGVDMISNVLERDASSTLFSFGEASSANSYACFGPMESDDPSTLGLVPRVCIHLLANVEDTEATSIDVSFMYVEDNKVYDLLSPHDDDEQQQPPPPLKVRENPEMGVYVERLSSYPMVEPSDVQYYVEAGLAARERIATPAQMGFTIFSVVVGGLRRIQLVDMGESKGSNSKAYVPSSGNEDNHLPPPDSPPHPGTLRWLAPCALTRTTGTTWSRGF